MKFILISGRRTALDPSFFFPFWLYSFFAPICHQPRTKRPFLMVRVEQLERKNFGHSASSLLHKVRFLRERRTEFSGWLASNQHLVPNSDWEKKVDMSPKWSTQQRKERGESCKKRRMWWPLPDCSFFFTTPPSVTGCRAQESEHLTLIRSAWHKFSQEDYNYIRKREKAFLTFTVKVMFHSLKNQSTISFQGDSVLFPLNSSLQLF